MAGELKVLFIGAELRSGSTLLDIALGQLPSFQSCGEIRSIWREALPENPLCSCGERFRKCEFWGEVGVKAFGGWDAPSTSAAVQLATELDRLKMVPLLLLARRWRALRAKVDAFAERLSRLYLAIRDVSGARVVVDSSKFPSTAILLSFSESIDLRLVHLVRDSRGVAYSWTKKIVKLDTGKLMPVQTPLVTAARWDYTNSMLHLAQTLGIPTLRLKYESFVRSPEDALRDVLRHVDEIHLEPHLQDILLGESVALTRPVHVIGGNYSKMHKSPRIRLDDEWKARMPWRQKAVVTALTLPLLGKYGYVPSVRSPAPHRRDA